LEGFLPYKNLKLEILGHFQLQIFQFEKEDFALNRELTFRRVVRQKLSVSFLPVKNPQAIDDARFAVQ
jgi:hypothetical protein